MQFVKHTKLNDDLFLVALPDGENTLLYAPLRRRAVQISNSFRDEIVNNTPAGKMLLDQQGFTHSTWAFPQAPRTDFKYHPSIPGSIMLSTTSRCNLRCAYCFADGGDYDDTMSWDVAQAFLDFVPTAARRNGNRYQVSFHGDGETLMAPDITYKICAELKRLAELHKFNLSISMTTNATLINESNIQLIKENFNHLGISFDGDNVAQTANRPMAGGKSSFSNVLRAVRLLKQYGVSYGFRATITNESVSRMPDMIDFIVDVMESNNVHFEPATACNRAGESMIPDAEDFVKYYMLAKARAAERNCRIFTSMARPDNISQSFCGTSNAGMTLLADGTITACSRVTHPEDPFIEKYVFGKFNKVSQTFEFNDDKVNALKTETIVTAYPECNDCFARWHCSGVCPANRDRGSVEYLCEMTQNLTLDGILDKFKANKFVNQIEFLKREEERAKQQAQVQPNAQAPMNAQDVVQ